MKLFVILSTAILSSPSLSREAVKTLGHRELDIQVKRVQVAPLPELRLTHLFKNVPASKVRINRSIAIERH